MGFRLNYVRYAMKTNMIAIGLFAGAIIWSVFLIINIVLAS
jgi:hypothetical protein